MPARFHLLHAGYIRDSGATVGSSVSLIEDDGALIVVDPDLVVPGHGEPFRNDRSADQSGG